MFMDSTFLHFVEFAIQTIGHFFNRFDENDRNNQGDYRYLFNPMSFKTCVFVFLSAVH